MLNTKDKIEALKKEKEKYIGRENQLSSLERHSEKMVKKVNSPEYYLTQNLLLPKDLEIVKETIHLENSNVTSLFNLKQCKGLDVHNCKLLRSLGSLESIEEFGDFRNTPQLTKFEKFKSCPNLYVNDTTSNLFLLYLTENNINFLKM